MITFGTKLRVMRALFKLRQADLVRQTKLTRRDIALFENEWALPTPQSQKIIEAVFNLDFDAPEVEHAFQVLAGQGVAEPSAVEVSS